MDFNHFIHGRKDPLLKGGKNHLVCDISKMAEVRDFEEQVGNSTKFWIKGEFFYRGNVTLLKISSTQSKLKRSRTRTIDQIWSSWASKKLSSLHPTTPREADRPCQHQNVSALEGSFIWEREGVERTTHKNAGIQIIKAHLCVRRIWTSKLRLMKPPPQEWSSVPVLSSTLGSLVLSVKDFITSSKKCSETGIVPLSE